MKVLVVAALVVGCSGKPAPSATLAVDAAVPADAAAPDAPSPPTKADRREYGRHLEAGRTLARNKQWIAATSEFEAALRAVPMDGRALSELGWAALQAGELDRAERANADSVRVSADPGVKAASLYNLGRVAEAKNDPAGAARFYTESLALRPSETVTARLKSLGVTPPAPPPVGPCATKGKCRSVKSGAGYEIVRFDGKDENAYFLAAASPWTIVAALPAVFHPGGAVVEDLELGDFEERTVGGRRLLWLETKHSHFDADAATGEVESSDETLLTLCVIGEARCPLQVPLDRTYKRWREEGAEAAAPDPATPGLPIRRHLQLKVDLSDDGVADSILVDGEAPEDVKPLLGPHKLW